MVSLVVLLMVGVVSTFVWLYYAIGRAYRLNSAKDSKGDVSLFSLQFFRMAWIVPFAISVLLAIKIGFDGNLGFELSSGGLLFSYEFFKVPLWVMALSFPLTAMVASNYRSVQVVEQMKLQRSQNNFANHYLHMEKFAEQMEAHCNKSKEDSGSFSYRWKRVHSFLYPASKDGSLDVPCWLVDTINGFMDSVDFAAIAVAECKDDTDLLRKRQRIFTNELVQFTGFMMLSFGNTFNSTNVSGRWLQWLISVKVVLDDIDYGVVFNASSKLAATFDLIDNTDNNDWLYNASVGLNYSRDNEYETKFNKARNHHA